MAWCLPVCVPEVVLLTLGQKGKNQADGLREAESVGQIVLARLRAFLMYTGRWWVPFDQDVKHERRGKMLEENILADVFGTGDRLLQEILR